MIEDAATQSLHSTAIVAWH